MSYRVQKKEKVSDAIRRIAGEEINSIIVQIRSIPLHSGTIHEARRHLKKLRALLRFVRWQLPSASFQREKQMLRAAAEILAPARDAHVLMKTLAGFGEVSADNTDRAFRRLRTALQKEGERCVPGKAELNKMEISLQAVLGRVEEWPLAKLGRRKVQQTLERSFRRCQKAFHQSLKTSDRSSFHAWRKRVKDLEYHLCLFEMAWRKKTARVWKQIKRLDDHLGQDHDLALLSEKLSRFKLENREWRDGSRKIAEQISKRRLNLQRSATKSARQLLRRRPGYFVSRNLDL